MWTPIFHAGPQLWKLRFISALSLAMAAVMLWLGAALWADPRSSPAETVLVGALILVVAIGFPLGMWIYGRCYVLAAEVDEAAARLRVTLAGFFIPATREMAIADLAGARYHHGQLQTHTAQVDAPWYSIRVRGRRLPLLLDVRGDFLDDARVRTLLLGQQPPSPGPGKPPAARKHNRRKG
jgi:hypothetical protein